MDDIQSWWEVPSIAHFCSLFRAAFNLLDFDIEELEEALLTDGAEDAGSSLLQELIVRLLCGCLGNNDISTFNYQMFLRRLFRKKCQEYGRDNPFNTDIDFQFLPLRTKVEILYALCDFRLDAEDVQDLLKNLESDSLRVEPLGYDENSSAYWYYYGTRLYREDFPKMKKKVKEKRRKTKEDRHRKKRPRSPTPSDDEEDKGPGEWQVVCFTEEDWEKLTESFRHSACKAERNLYRTLSEDFLPEIPRLFAEKERLQRKRLLEFQPRRCSSRVEKMKQQKREKEKEEEKMFEEKQKQKQEEKVRSQRVPAHHKDRATRAENRARSYTTSECGSIGSVGDSGTERGPVVGRQTNNSLASATGQIVIQGLRRKLRTSQVFKQTAEDLQTGLYKILEHIKNQEDAWPFVDPVDEAYAPRYYSIISKPMDLNQMEDKLDRGHYHTFADFRADFQLIVENCRQYNGTDNEYTEMVGKLQEAFQLAVDRYLESDPSSDEEVAVEFPTESQDAKPVGANTVRKKRKMEEQEELEEEPHSPSPVKEESENSVQSSDSETKQDTEESSSEPRKTHSHNGAKRSKKTGVMKNAAAIEALELATEQTLKDINKWLDDTPRFSEFSSASNSPSHFITAEEYDMMGSRIDNEYRRNLKLDRSSKGNKDAKDSNKRRPNRDQVKQRRREIQRTIDRLQPGKSKGNLISNFQNANKPDEGGAQAKGKDKSSSLVADVEPTPKLSLGTVLTNDVLGFGVGCQGHSFDPDTKIEKNLPVSAAEEVLKKCATPPGPEPVKLCSADTRVKKEKSCVEPDRPAAKDTKSEKATPNHSAWFKAFGAPKPAPVQKKKIEANQECDIVRLEDKKFESVSCSSSPVPVESTAVIARPVAIKHGPTLHPEYLTNVEVKVNEELERKLAQSPHSRLGDEGLSPHVIPRQRKVSTGSSVSERSSFSQDLIDPLDGSSPRISLDERLGGYQPPYPSPLHRSPMAASPVMVSPRPEELTKPAYPPLNGTIRPGFYQDTSSVPKSSPEKSNSNSPSAFPTYSSRTYPPAHDPGGFVPYSLAQDSVMQFYDTSKPLTDQYRAARTQATDVVTTQPYNQQQSLEASSPRPTMMQKPSATMFPVKKRIFSDMDAESRLRLPAVEKPPSQTAAEKLHPTDMRDSPPTGQGTDKLHHDSAVRSRLHSPIVVRSPQPHYTSAAMEPPDRPPISMSQVLDRLHHGQLPLSQPSAISSVHLSQTSEGLQQNSPSVSQATIMSHPTSRIHHTAVTTVVSAPSSDRSSGIHGGEVGYSRRSFSPPPMDSPMGLRGNLNNMPHIVDRFAGEERLLSSLQSAGPPYFADKGLGPSHMFSQSGASTLQAPVSSGVGLFSQAPSSMSVSYSHERNIVSSPLGYSRPVAELSSMLSGKDIPPGYNRPGPEMTTTPTISVPSTYRSELSSILPGKVTSSLSVQGTYNRSTADLTSMLTNKGASPDMHRIYNHPATELTSVITSKVPPGVNVAGNYGRQSEFSSMLPSKGASTTEVVATKPSRKRKTKQASVATSESAGVPGSTAFQQYVGSKSGSGEPSAISLKTTSVVPGSAFNFGPTPSALGLYADKDSYPGFLEEYRPAPAGYYIGSDPVRDKAPTASSSFPFLTHPQPRPAAYSFMNPHQASLVDASGAPSQLYHQYIQRQQEELLRHSGNPMVLHQGLLAPPAGYPPGYHPALSIRQPYDRPPWI